MHLTNSPAFKGYVKAPVSTIDKETPYGKEVTFNTNGIAFTEGIGGTKVIQGGKTWEIMCPYKDFQRMCLESDMPENRGRVVKRF